MPTYEEMFGRGDGKSYLKIQNEDEKVEAIYLDYEKVPQKFDDGKPKFMVLAEAGGQWKPMRQGEFDADKVENSFPAMDMQLKLEVDGRVKYHTLSKTSEEAFVDALKKSGGIDEGDTIGLWLVSTAKKPYTWKHVIVRQEK